MKLFFQKYLGFFISALVIFTSVLQGFLLKENVIIALLIATILSVGALWNHILTVWSPMKEIKKAKQERWGKMNVKLALLETDWKNEYGYSLSFNIMIPKQGFLYRMRPKTVLFFPKIFRVVWEYGSSHVNSNLRLTTDQGSAGRAYKYEDTKIYDMEKRIRLKQNIQKEFNLTGRQMRYTEGITFLASFPIFLPQKTEDQSTSIIVGVLNVESTDKGAGSLAADKEAILGIMSITSEISKSYISIF